MPRSISKPVVRWCVLGDIPEMLKIETKSFEYPWSTKDFEIFLRKKDHIGLVLEYNDKLVGYMIYQCLHKGFRLISLAVSPRYRKKGFAKTLVQYLTKRVANQTDLIIEAQISDTKLEIHNFMKSLNFKATKVIKNYFGPDQDAYNFVFNEKNSDSNTSTTKSIVKCRNR